MSKGKVIIAGAGPGDPDLITIKAARYLRNADVILCDRLVNDQILQIYASDDAEIIHVGKQCSLGVSTPQETINDLLVCYAQRGKLVVRLKGGDVSIFSNILDELQILTSNQIDYEIIPGVTAALGAAAYGGIPLTARGISTSVRFLTFYKSSIIGDSYWNELAETPDTLVFYMSSESLPIICENLIKRNIDPSKLLGIVEQATTPNQKIYVSNIYEFAKLYDSKRFISPTLIIIGKVVALHNEFKWVADIQETNQPFFKDAEGVQQRLTA
ncbi:MAG: uroporphyrinogen-III C-methyltransferase [Ginsengibacter sp.]